MALRLAVVGVIGSGKSTWARALAENLRAKYIPERYQENAYFRRCSSVPLEAPIFASQATFLTFSANEYLDAAEGTRDIVMDSTAHDTHHVLSKWHHYNGRLSQHHFDVLEDLYGEMSRLLPPFSGVVYLRPQVPTVLSRIRSRGRPFERHLTEADLRFMVEARDALWPSSPTTLWLDNANRDLSVQSPLEILDGWLQQLTHSGDPGDRDIPG